MVTASPGYINLGMTTTIQATAPAAGTYTLMVEQPNGTESTYSFVFAAAGQALNATYGNSTEGFRTSVDVSGTYNVFLESGGQVVSSTSFYATAKLQVSMDMVTGGTCAYIAGATRGTKMFPRFYVNYASDGAPVTNTDPGIHVTYTLPDGANGTASWDSGARLFVGKVQPNWNYTYVGPWSPTAWVEDAAGNSAVYQYAGSPFVISPVDLSTALQVLGNSSGQVVTTLSDGVSVTIQANITYPSNPEPVSGFLGPLDSARGGSVTAEVGWGYYNETSGTFGGSVPGGLIGTVNMAYTGSNGTWEGQFESNSLPTLKGGATYLVVVASHDGASPANTGFATEVLSSAPSTASVQTTTTVTITLTLETIPSVVYAALAILLVLGVIIGYIVRVPR